MSKNHQKKSEMSLITSRRYKSKKKNSHTYERLYEKTGEGMSEIFIHINM